MRNGQLIFLYSLFSTAILFCTNVATQTITFSVDPISEIAVSGDPPPFLATVATAGSNPSDVIDNSTFYAVTTNGTGQKVTASLDTAMPAGTMLCLMATAPNGATTAGTVDLDTSDQNIVVGISQVAQSNLQLSYVFEVTAAAGTIPLTTRIVTLTLAP